MGYEAWKEFIYPAVMRMYKAVRDDGKYVFIHSCGDVDELFDDLIGIGVHCFNPFEPGVMDVDVIMNNYRSRLAFWGGLSMNTTASLGSYHKLIDQARHLIEMGRQGGYILSPSHFIEADTPIENTLALIEVCKSQKNYKKRLYF
jgi:uroporphyrinogen decarboxylase